MWYVVCAVCDGCVYVVCLKSVVCDVHCVWHVCGVWCVWCV